MSNLMGLLSDVLSRRARGKHVRWSFSVWPQAPDSGKHDMSEAPVVPDKVRHHLLRVQGPRLEKTVLDPSWLLFHRFAWIFTDFIDFLYFRGRGLGTCAADVLPLQKPLLDLSWLLFHRLSLISYVFIRFHKMSWISCVFSEFHELYGFRKSGNLCSIPAGCYFIDFH